MAAVFITDMFAARVCDHAESIALIAADGAFTYKALGAKANRVANALRARSIGPGERVMLLLNRNSDFVASLLGVMITGAAFIPVDPDYPAERIEHVRVDSSSRFIITNKDMPGALDIAELLAQGDEAPPEPADISGRDISYIIYTSGSTGTPKGVVITHGGVANYVDPAPENIFAHTVRNRAHAILTVATVAFDFFLNDLFLTLLHGRTLVFADEEASKNPYEMARLIEAHGVDIISITPERIMQYLRVGEYSRALAKCKCLFIGGEAFPPVLLDKLRAITSAEIYNCYGPTETTIISHIGLVKERINIGKPQLNCLACVMDAEGKPVEQGEKGELYIGGPGVSPGYLGRDALNREKFTTIDGIRYFKSGDTAYIDENGDYYIVGRIDHQVKLRGLRIELGEIESLIGRYPGVDRAVVRVKKLGGNDYLVAYYTDNAPVDIPSLKAYLASKLVPYMMPSHYIPMDSFKLNVTGKIDDKCLPEPRLHADEIVAPRTELERDLHALCADMLGFDAFGVTNSLGSIGFTSLSFISMAVHVLDKYGVELKLTRLMRRDSTIEAICREIESSSGVCAARHAARERYPLAPQQLPLTLRNPVNDIYRAVAFAPGIEAAKLREALVAAVNDMPYLFTTFMRENGELWQSRGQGGLAASEVPVYNRKPTDDDYQAFCRPFDIFDRRLFAFALYDDGTEVTMLMHIHHILIDHAGMKVFFDRVLGAYNDPAFKPGPAAEYFEYALELDERRRAQREADEVNQEAPPESAGGRKDIAPASPIRRASARRFLSLAGMKCVLDAHDISVSGLLLAAVGWAAAKALNEDKLIIYNTFGGRNDAKFFGTIGYFPFSVPVCFDAGSPALLDVVGAESLAAFERYSPFNDAQYQRLTNKRRIDPFILYNYMEVFDGAAGDLYKIRDLRSSDATADDDAALITPHLEFNCLSQGDRGIIMLEYDEALLDAAQAEALLDGAESFLRESR